MRKELRSWKILVVALAAVLGAGLGFGGAHAPRLNATISGIGATPAAPVPSAGSTGPGTPAPSPSAGSARSAAPAPAPSAGSPPASVGPLLSETRYGAYAYQVYPAASSPDTDRALTGFRLSFRRVNPATVEVTVADLQDGTTQTAAFNSGDRLYFIETRMGDDGFDGETNLGDDGFVLTDADGHILAQ